MTRYYDSGDNTWYDDYTPDEDAAQALDEENFDQHYEDEIEALGCYSCGHEASELDPCDPTCTGLLSWLQATGVA